MKADVARRNGHIVSERWVTIPTTYHGGGLQDTEGHDPGENVCLQCGSSN